MTPNRETSVSDIYMLHVEMIAWLFTLVIKVFSPDLDTANSFMSFLIQAI